MKIEKKQKNLAGFTLIEIIVALTLFILIMSALIGLFFNALQAQRRALASQELMDSVSYNMEYMSRAIRMARKELSDPPACLSSRGLNYEETHGGNGLRFINYRDVCQEFFLDNGRIYETKNGETFPLTPVNLEVTSFELGGSETWGQEEREQPKVILFLEIKGKGEKPELQPEIKIQTTISQRNLNVRY